MKCEHCKFYIPMNQKIPGIPEVKDISGGRCRRYPPTVQMLSLGTVQTRVLGNPQGAGQQFALRCELPIVDPEHWCGEHEPNPRSINIGIGGPGGGIRSNA